MKRCTKCKETKGAEQFAKCAKHRDGLRSTCKQCEAQYQRDRKAKDPGRVAALEREKARRWRERHPERAHAACKKYRDANPDKVRRWTREWQTKHHEKYLRCKRENAKKHYPKNAAKQAERIRAWQSTEHGKSINRAKAKRWRERNLELARARDKEKRVANREQILASARKWRKANREREAMRIALRRHVQLSIPAWGEPEKIKLVYKRARQLGFEVDHVVPVKSEIVTGLHVWHNLQLLDKSTNMRKQNRHWPDMP